MMKDKFRAFAIHLAISITIIGGLSILFLAVYYPDPIDQLEGVERIIFILACVDIVIGPMLTFILYRKGKWGLKFDLFTIGILQAAALIYGMTSIFLSRPVHMVFSIDRFVLVSYSDINIDELIINDLKLVVMEPLSIVAAEFGNEEEKQKVMMETVFEGKKDLAFRPEYYIPFENVTETLKTKANPIRKILTKELRERHKSLLAKYKIEDLGYFPVVGKKKDMAVIIDRNTGDIVDYFDVDPWQ
ncbi:MAG: hypothetical protein HWE27_10470 [Gammaproteobacteria bacterium]|nr:hypothetical protein [Gammaproteobacteria bacterium]